MKIIEKKSELSVFLNTYRKNNNKIGFVPTMGALHAGHISLVSYSVSSCDVTVVSIFVNPTQFNDPRDLEKYPRTLDRDLEMLEKAGCDVVFVPSVEEMYPGPDGRIFDMSPLDSVMEGAARPGHFNGVAQIVSKLFDVVKPDEAFFGEKDFQQLSIIRLMCSRMGLGITITGCPIIREKDGLAMSSRNVLLTPSNRKAAPAIYCAMQKGALLCKEYSPEQLKQYITDLINKEPGLSVEYFEIMDQDTLVPIVEWSKFVKVRGFAAVKAGPVRLIDNMEFFS